MKAVFVTGTAGSGKSLLTSKLHEYYTRNGAFPAVLNLDPGVENLPYTPDIDVRNHVDLPSVMRQYDLGPNGALVMANDLIAAKFDDINGEIQSVNPDYLIVDTPGQIELFAYRTSGPFVMNSIDAEQKAVIYLFDGAIITTPTNFVSISLLATSIKLRLQMPTLNIVTKSDLIEEKINKILEWSTNLRSLEDAISGEVDGETYTLSMNILRGMDLGGFAQGLIPVSNVTGDGMINLEGALSRAINLGEEVEN